MAHGYARATEKPAFAWQPQAQGPPTWLLVSQMRSWTVYHWLPSRVRCTNSLSVNGLSETDFFGMTLPIVKHGYLVLTAEDLPKIVKEAFYLAESGRLDQWSLIFRKMFSKSI